MKKYLFPSMIIVLVMFFTVVNNLEAAGKAKKRSHILVIGIDGLGAHGIAIANTPHLDELMEKGASSLEARTVMPSVSGPAWSSMITGTSVERHGVWKNGWKVDNKILEPVFKGEHDMFPTIFGEIRKHNPGAEIGAVYHWKDFGNFIERGVCDVSIPCESEDEATRKACDYLAEKHPHFLFVQLDHVDHGGHSGGYRSEEYVRSIEKADSLVGVFMETLRNAEMADETVVFILADHGGFEKGHGGCTPDEMVVPLIISGKNVKRGTKMEHPLFTYDLAPTVAWLFGFRLNEWTTGKPLKDAFLK